MNHERMLELADHLDALPRERFNLARWFVNKPANYEVWDHSASAAVGAHNSHPCGTVGCIAGWAVALFAQDDEGAVARSRYVRTAAAKILGLAGRQAMFLFIPDEETGWPGKAARCDFVDRESVTPQMAAAELRRLVAEDRAKAGAA